MVSNLLEDCERSAVESGVVCWMIGETLLEIGVVKDREQRFDLWDQKQIVEGIESSVVWRIKNLNLVHLVTLKALSFADWLVGLLVYSRFSMTAKQCSLSRLQVGGFCDFSSVLRVTWHIFGIFLKSWSLVISTGWRFSTSQSVP